MFPGIGTLVNVVAVLLGTVIGVLVGHRLTSAPVTWSPTGSAWSRLLIAGLSAVAVPTPPVTDAVGQRPMLIVLGSL